MVVIVTAFEDRTAPVGAAAMVAGVTLGGVAGAVYNPFVLIVPSVAFPPSISFTNHFTAVFELPVIVAMNCRFSLVPTVADVGLTLI